MVGKSLCVLVLACGVVAAGCASPKSSGNKKDTGKASKTTYDWTGGKTASQAGATTKPATAGTTAKPSTVSPVVVASPSTVANAANDKKDVSKQKPDAEPVVKHVHMKFKDKDSEKEYLSLVSQREQIHLQAKVLNDLLAEKKAELGKFNKSLTEKFSIDPARSYEYDAKSQTISALTVADGDGASGAAKVTKSVHLKLKNKEQTDSFVRLAAAKKMTLDEIQSLSLMATEKQMEAKACEDSLMSKFSLKSGASYEYDAKSSLIYEVPSRVVDSSKR